MDWPSLCIGVIVAFYWAYVLKLIARSRRRTGKSANLVPHDPIGRIMRSIWIPAIVIWIVHPFVSFQSSLHWSILQPQYDQPVLKAIAVAISGVALGATVFCWKQMGSSWRIGIDPSETTRLIFGGPYAYVRHPIYTLSSAMMAATVVAIPSPLMMVTGLIHLTLLQWEARREEQYLLTRHGEQYGAYLKQVGRFMPKSLLPYQSHR